MRQEGVSTSPGGRGMWHRLFRLPRMAIAVVVLAVAVAVAIVAVGRRLRAGADDDHAVIGI